MDLVTVSSKEEGNGAERVRRISGECEGIHHSKIEPRKCVVHRPMDWDETDMRQLADGRWQSGKLVGSVGTHVGHAADEVWKTGARSEYAFE
jgi:hypothetical protein